MDVNIQNNESSAQKTQPMSEEDPFAINLLNSTVRYAFAKESNRWDKKNGVWRLPSVAYTLEHKLAVLEREHYLFGRYSLRGLVHDMDKPILYLIPGLSDEKSNAWHQKYQGHHFNGDDKKVEQLMEAYVDWDSAAITKPDKPLDAFATLIHFYPNEIEKMLPVCMAINPSLISTTVSDLDEWRKKTYSGYVFKTPEQGQAIFERIKTTVQSIAENLPTDDAAVHRPIRSYPKRVGSMTSTEIFLKTLAFMAKYRREEIDCAQMRQTVEAINADFQGANAFTLREKPEPIEHHYARKMRHPFIRKRGARQD